MQIVIDLPDKNYQVTLTKIMLACYGCRIIELPKGHGRLIDADKLWDSYHNLDYDFYEALDLADAIIEAESEEV